MHGRRSVSVYLDLPRHDLDCSLQLVALQKLQSEHDWIHSYAIINTTMENFTENFERLFLLFSNFILLTLNRFHLKFPLSSMNRSTIYGDGIRFHWVVITGIMDIKYYLCVEFTLQFRLTLEDIGPTLVDLKYSKSYVKWSNVLTFRNFNTYICKYG